LPHCPAAVSVRGSAVYDAAFFFFFFERNFSTADKITRFAWQLNSRSVSAGCPSHSEELADL